MATTTQSESQQYVDFDEYVEFQLQKIRKQVRSHDLLLSTLTLCTFLIGYLFLFAIFDQWIIPGGFSYSLRLLLLVGFIGIVSGWLWFRIWRPYRQQINALYAARVIEKAVPELKSRVLNLIDFRHADRKPSPSILRAMEKQAALKLSNADLEEAVDNRPVVRVSYALLAVLFIFFLYMLLSPKNVFPSVWRALFPTADVEVATRTRIDSVLPGNTTVYEYSDLDVTAVISGDKPEELTLYYTTTDQTYVDEPVRMIEDPDEALPTYTGKLVGQNGEGIRQEFTYYVQAGDTRSETFTVEVIAPPQATLDTVTLDHPDYMQLPDQVQENGHIDSWEGTVATLRAHTNTPVKSAEILFSDDESFGAKAESYALEVGKDGTSLTGSWKLALRTNNSHAKFYRIQVRTAEGQLNRNPMTWHYRVKPDAAPEVRLYAPSQDIESPANARVPLMFRAEDPDFLLSRVRVFVEKEGEQIFRETILDSPRKKIEGRYLLPLNELALSPGDVLSYYIEAEDNKQPEHNKTPTGTLKITIVERIPEREADKRLEEQKKQQDQLREELEKQRQEQQQDPQQQNDQQQNSDQQQAEGGADQEQGAPQDGSDGQQDQQSSENQGGDPQPGEQGTDEGADPSQEQQPGAEPGNDPGTADPSQQDQSQDGNNDSNENSPQPDSEPGAEQPASNEPGQNQERTESGDRDPNSERSPNEGTQESGGENSSGREQPNGSERNEDTTGTDREKNQLNPESDVDEAEALQRLKDHFDKEQQERGEGTQQDTENQQLNDGNREKQQEARPEPDGDQANQQKPEQQPDADEQNPGEEQKSQDKTKPEGANKQEQSSKTDEGSSEQKGSSSGNEDQDTEKSGANNDQPGSSQKPQPGDENPSNPEGGTEDKTGTNESGDSKSDEQNPRGDKKTQGDKQSGEQSPQQEPAESQEPGNREDEAGRDEQAEKRRANGDESPANDPDQPKSDNSNASDPSGEEQNREQQEAGDSKNSDSNPEQSPDGGAPNDAERKQNPNGEGEKTEFDPNANPDNQRQGDQQDAANQDQDNTRQSPDQQAGEKQNTNKGGSDQQQQSQSDQDDQQQSDQQQPGGEAAEQNDSDQQEPGNGNQEQKQSSDQENPQENQPPGNQSGEGSKSDQESGNQSDGGDQPSQKQDQQPQQGGTDKPGGDSTDATSPPTKGGGQGSNSSSSGSGQGTSETDASAANEEYAREAAELILKKLDDQIQRGDVDQDLLEKLGWNESQLERFTERLKKQLATDAPQTPRERASQEQFKEMLKSLNFNDTERSSSGRQMRKYNQSGINIQRTPVPDQYRKRLEEVNRSQSRIRDRQP